MTRTRAFWWGYVAAVTLYAGAAAAFHYGPGIEAKRFPVRVDQTVHDIERDGAGLCWTWSSLKVRDRRSDDMDAYLWVRGQRYVVAIHRASDGEPWSQAGALPVGGPHHLRYCTTLPPSVRPADDLRLEQVAWFPGLLGLWRVPLRIPDVVSPGSQS